MKDMEKLGVAICIIAILILILGMYFGDKREEVIQPGGSQNEKETERYQKKGNGSLHGSGGGLRIQLPRSGCDTEFDKQ